MVTERILIVDDDQGALDLLSAYLEAFGFDSATAEDGTVAVQKLEEGNFTIVLTDMVMPRMDGMQLLKYIRDHYPKVGVIVITGHGKTSYTDVIKAGASDFIAKPFTADELEAKLNRLVRELSLVRQLEQYSVSDALTELYNRRYFDNKILAEVQRAERQHYSVFFQMIDVDNLKAHNDKAGHQSGDRLLQTVGRILQQSIREHVDWAFRYGGDEFGVISTQVEAIQIARVAQRILERYAQEQFTDTGLSMGIARFVRHPGKTWQEDIDELVARADRALYRAKNQGKNQVVFDAEV